MSVNFPFQENLDVFAGEKIDKEYWIKINSKDATDSSPFDFQVKFNMPNFTNNNQEVKGANINSNYKDIKKLEVSDVIIPRYLPNTTIGLNFDGVQLVKHPSILTNPTDYYVSCYPGIIAKPGSYTSSPATYKYIKLQNYKECVILTTIYNSDVLTNDTSTFKYKDLKTIDHINIQDASGNNNIYPITVISNNLITINPLNETLPSTAKFIMGNYFANMLVSLPNPPTFTSSSLTLPIPASMCENIYYSNILRLTDGSSSVFSYFQVTTSTSSVNTTTFKGEWIGGSANFSDTVYVYTFGFGATDLIDQRIFFLELNPFVPVKSSASNNQYDKMFGVLFPSTQSKDWLYLSGEPRESFLPRDLRKLDRITFKLYDSEGNALNDIYKNRPGLLNTNYFKNIYTTVILKIEEVDKSLIAKKS